MDRSGQQYQAINAQFPASPYKGACHEWWSGDDTISYIEYDTGVHQYTVSTGQTEHIWAEPLCHAHSDPSNRYLVADQSPYFWNETPCQVLHYDRITKQRTAIAVPFPNQPAAMRPCVVATTLIHTPNLLPITWYGPARSKIA